MQINMEVAKQSELAQKANKALANMGTPQKNAILLAMAAALEENISTILAANTLDLDRAQDNNMPSAMVDRLLLNEKRVHDMAQGLRLMAELVDPIGEIIGGKQLPNGLIMSKIRVPLGTIAIIYESRPNVTADAIGLCLKSGNAVVLRGGSEAISSNMAIVKVLTAAGVKEGLPVDSIQYLAIVDRRAVECLLKQDKFIDVIIPRGGAELINFVKHNSTVPVIETGIGVCHIFVDESADLTMAKNIIINAKTSRPAVCNAVETILIHKSLRDNFLPQICKELKDAGVEIFGCPNVCDDVPFASEVDVNSYRTEYMSLKINIRLIDDIDAAMDHIVTYGTKHSESIVTNSFRNARKFQLEVDSAVVFVNASTRFTDGFEFGFGAEIGISTQKLHARGPMGLPELTSIKYLVRGDGHIR